PRTRWCHRSAMMAPVEETPPDHRWAAPGTAADGAQPGAPAPAPIVGHGTALAAPGHLDGDGAAVPALTLRPMTHADVLDGGFAVIKARPRAVLGFAAWLVVPAQLAVALAQREAWQESGTVEVLSADPTVFEEAGGVGLSLASVFAFV